MDDESDEVVEEEEVIDPTLIPDEIDARPEWFMFLNTLQENFVSPIDLSIGQAEPLELKPLIWSNYDIIPKAVKITNTGYTLLICARYENERPYITGGTLTEKYIFSQIHFHWGRNNMEGSEHSVEGTKYPLEMHVIHYNEKYDSQENATQHKDGLCVLAYFYKLEDIFNKKIQMIINYIPEIRNAHESVKIKEFPLLKTLVKPFFDDYLLYWGSIMAKGVVHPVIWMICREPFPITIEQMENFREMRDINGEKINRNFHSTFPREDRRIFHVNRSTMLYSTLYPLPYDPPKINK